MISQSIAQRQSERLQFYLLSLGPSFESVLKLRNFLFNLFLLFCCPFPEVRRASAQFPKVPLGYSDLPPSAVTGSYPEISPSLSMILSMLISHQYSLKSSLTL